MLVMTNCSAVLLLLVVVVLLMDQQGVKVMVMLVTYMSLVQPSSLKPDTVLGGSPYRRHQGRAG